MKLHWLFKGSVLSAYIICVPRSAAHAQGNERVLSAKNVASIRFQSDATRPDLDIEREDSSIDLRSSLVKEGEGKKELMPEGHDGRVSSGPVPDNLMVEKTAPLRFQEGAVIVDRDSWQYFRSYNFSLSNGSVETIRPLRWLLRKNFLRMV